MHQPNYLERKSLPRGLFCSASLLPYLGQKLVLRSLAELRLSPTETRIAESGPPGFQFLVERTGGDLKADAQTGKPPPLAGGSVGNAGPRPGT